MAEKLELECKFGTLTASVFSDDEGYRELAIDLTTKDGRQYQVCVVGTNESVDGLARFNEEERINYTERIHIYMWDGNDQDCSGYFYMDPDGDGYWSEG